MAASPLSAHDPFRGEAAELEATNAHLSRQLDEVRAECMFDSARLQRSEEAAAKRSHLAWLTLEKERGDTARVDYVVQVRGLQEELVNLRAELQAESENALEMTRSGGANGFSTRPGAVTDAVARDLRDKHEQLSSEHRLLCEDRSALQQQILEVRSELTESGQRLKRIEDACVRTRAMADRQRIQVATLQEQTLRAESDLREADERLPTVAFERSRVEETIALQNVQRETLAGQNVQLRKDQEFLSSKLAELQQNMEGQTKEHWELLSEARILTQEHASEEQSLARQHLVCSRLEGEVACLRSENAQVQRHVWELHEAGESAENDAKQAANEAMQHCHYLRTQLPSGFHVGKQQAAGAQAVVELQNKLQGVEREYRMLGTLVHDRASKFAEETGPLYSEVQRLHASLSELRKLNAHSSYAVEQGVGHGIDSLRHGLSPALGASGGSSNTFATHLSRPALERPHVPALRLGGLATAVAQPPPLDSHWGAEGALQGSTAGTTLGWVEGEVSHLFSQLQETATRREEILQRFDGRRSYNA